MPIAQDEYLKLAKKDKHGCPMCESRDFHADHVEVDRAIAFQICTCSKCNCEWVDVYTLTRYEINAEGSTEEDEEEEEME
jgi:hypothetical protein